MARLDIASKAQHYFELYYALGAERSLERLRVRCKELGIPVPALSTVGLWSSRFGWQDEIARRLEREKQVAADRAAVEIERMNDRQAWLGAALQNIAAEALSGFRHEGKLVRSLEPGEIAQLVREGVKTERLARGAATDREEITVSVWTTVLVEIAALFLQINELPNSEQRKAEFADGVDQIARKHVGMIAAQQT